MWLCCGVFSVVCCEFTVLWGLTIVALWGVRVWNLDDISGNSFDSF